MAVDDTAPRAQRPGPIALADLFDAALKDLAPKSSSGAPASLPAPTPTPPTSGDAFLFSGNRHESVPRRLFLDRRLTPLERNAWQVFRLMLNDDGVTAFPTYEQLRPWLASMPCAGQASHETVARALTLLRLTRWLSLVRRRRDPKTGRILGNLYVLHDEPLTPFEAMQLDADYLALVSQSLGHSAKAVQVVGLNTLQEIADDPMLSGRTLPSRLQVLAERLAEPPDLDEMAEQVGLSKYHLLRAFKKATGLSPRQWSMQLRTRRALGLLRRGLAVGEVAHALGFADQSHLTRYFTSAYGISPGRYQRAVRG